MEEDYNGIPAPDLFAYTAVDYNVQEYGMEKLNLLLRTPQAMEDVLEVSKGMFEDGWQDFMHDQYHNDQTKESPEP